MYYKITQLKNTFHQLVLNAFVFKPITPKGCMVCGLSENSKLNLRLWFTIIVPFWLYSSKNVFYIIDSLNNIWYGRKVPKAMVASLLEMLLSLIDTIVCKTSKLTSLEARMLPCLLVLGFHVNVDSANRFKYTIETIPYRESEAYLFIILTF